MGIFLFSSPPSWGSAKQHMVHLIQQLFLRQRETDVRVFAYDFLFAVNEVDYSDNADLKEIFNNCLREPLSPVERGSLEHLMFWDFVYHIYNCGELSPLDTEFPHTDSFPIPPLVSGSQSPPMTQKQRRRKKVSASSATPS